MRISSGAAWRVAALPLFIAGILFLEIHRPFPTFRLATFVLFLLLLIDLTSLLRGRLRDTLLLVVSLAFGLTLIEAACDFAEPTATLTATPGLTVPVPVMGWGPGHAGRFNARKVDAKTGKVIYDVNYTIDSDLLRETRSCASCAATVAFFGGSFTFGEGLNDADTLPQAFADRVGGKIRVLNVGFSGYGPEQFLREMQTGRFDKIIGRRPVLFVFLTAPWHAIRTSCKASWVLYGPRYRLENGKVVYAGRCADGVAIGLREWLMHSAAFSSLVEPFLERLNHSDLDLYVRMLGAAAHLAQQKYGVKTLILYMKVPPAFFKGMGFTDAEIVSRLRREGAVVADATLARERGAGHAITIPDEHHPNAYANRLRAEIVEDYVKRDLRALLAPEPDKTGGPLAATSH